MIVVKKDGSGNPVTEYYVGTAAGLFGVENLGTTLMASGSPSWQREGATILNFAVINSLAYRPEDNVMASWYTWKWTLLYVILVRQILLQELIIQY